MVAILAERGWGLGKESLCDDTTDKRNVVLDSLDGDDDDLDKDSVHGEEMVVEIRLYLV